MINLLKDFKNSLEENQSFPKDELRDYYLMSSKNILNNNQIMTEVIYEDQSILMMVIKKILSCTHPIRANHLGALAWDIILSTPKEILNYQDREGNSAAHLTCYMESFSVGLLDLMKQSGMNFTLQNKKGETPLILVANSNLLDDVKFINAYTNRNALDIQDINGFTALHRAVKGKKLQNIFFLLEQGANLFIKDKEGLSVCEWIEQPQFINRSSYTFLNELRNMLKIFADKKNAEIKIEKMYK